MNMSSSRGETPSLAGKVAVVTGASRGVGKGCALGLGEAGATVYVTGRTLGGAGATSGIVEVADAVTALGGRGIAVQCDHADDAAVEALVGRVVGEQGRIDVLVNNCYSRPDTPFFGVPFWKQPRALWDEMDRVGLRSHWIASMLVAPIMVEQRSGLIANISSAGGAHYLFNAQYGTVKAAVDKMAHDMAVDLAPHGVSAVSLWPGYVKTERIAALFERGAKLPFDYADGHSAQLVGRAIAYLAVDPALREKSGSVLLVGELARAYGFTDLDGTVPPIAPPLYPSVPGRPTSR
jgi:dehydrogenase/reductase SDR family protein 1